MDEKDFVQALKEAFVPLFINMDIKIDRIENDMKEIKSRLDSIENRVDFMETDVKDIRYKVIDVMNDLLNISSDTRKTKLIIENEIRPGMQMQIRNGHNNHNGSGSSNGSGGNNGSNGNAEKVQELFKKDEDVTANALRVLKNLTDNI